ncbi:MAG: 4Fe-4S binding protein [Candidatus Bathyarchaeota archaeon]|jgi:polyferredoxin|nr:4Fe-4S binding protein [Candidatus Bathyarchaeota archaeon A05DMB-3]MDH7606561.1 4Fe-4S binding protein [Candidatus Bathyarchaeota archaeon]
MLLEIISELLKLTIFAGLALAGILAILIWKKNLTTKVTYLRTFVQVVAMIAFFYIFSYTTWLLLILVVIFAISIVLGRFFCGWLCPFGLYLDLVAVIRKTLNTRYWSLPEKLNRSLHILRYLLLVFFIVLPFMLGPIEAWQWSLAKFLMGPFKPISVLLGPVEPLIIPWESPLKLYGLSFSYPYASIITFYSGENFALINTFIFMALTLASSFVVRRFWCRFCPTGASLAIVNRFRVFKWIPFLRLSKVEEKCTKCGICKRVCPVQVTDVYEQKGGDITTSMCMLCLRCVEMCPYEDCLKLSMAGKTLFKSRNWLEPSKIT